MTVVLPRAGLRTALFAAVLSSAVALSQTPQQPDSPGRPPAFASRPGMSVCVKPCGLLHAASDQTPAGALCAIPSSSNDPFTALGLFSEVTRGAEGGELEGYGPYSTGLRLALNSYGQRSQANTFQLDGAPNNEPWLRGPVIPPSPEATECLCLASGHVPASFGPATGAAVALRTRSGSDRWHGAAFYRHGNSALNARNFFDGADKPPSSSHQSGFSAGGPLRSHSWHLFTSAELDRSRQGLTVISTVPSTLQKLGEFAPRPIYDPLTIQEIRPVEFLRQPFPANRIPRSRIPEPARRLAALFPAPNLPADFHNFRHTPSRLANSDRLDLRADHTSAALNLTTRANYMRRSLNSPSSLPNTAASNPAQHASAALTRSSAFSALLAASWRNSPMLVHFLRASHSFTSLRSSALDSGLDSSAALAIPGLGFDGIPVFRLTGYAQLGAAAPAPFHLRTSTWHLEYSASRNTPRHSWSFGAQILRHAARGNAVEWPARGVFLFTPDYTSQPGVDGTGDAFASLLTGYPAEIRRDVQFEPYRLRGWEWSAFVQDHFRLGPVTIDAGLRYSLLPPLTEAADRLVNFNHDREALAVDWFAAHNGVNRYAGAGYNRRAFAPRLGFALPLPRRSATVLRGSFSQMFDTGPYLFRGLLARNPPFASRLDLFAGSLQLGPSLAAGIPTPEPLALLDVSAMNRAQNAVYAFEPSTYTPYSLQWDLRLETRLPRSLALEIAGMASMGVHLYSMLNANQPYPAPTPYAWRRHPYDPFLGRIDHLGLGGGSTYYGGQIRLSGSPAARLHAFASYRYAKAIDDAPPPMSNQRSRSPGAQYIYHPRSMRAASSFDVTHRLTLAAVCDLPSPNRSGFALRALLSGWRAAASFVAQSGLPFTPELAVNGLNNGGFWLPNRVGKGTLPSSQRSVARWFNPSLDPSDPTHAFETPPLYQYGNSGYNILRGPRLFNLDAALFRSFRLTAPLSSTLRLELFNLLNRPHFALPERILGLPSSGAISHTTSPARQLQAELRLSW
ncbi:MAG: hypothetical protein K6T61_10145 [Bryobacteraceae bacterium]|nr:hypothetical protein [Bryobacteraceae bacterium]